ncbi:MAG: hypothetical protein IJZ19_11325 [Lentisphaeria bacterium]|nr:hypothetical protein [Lentisphaeria bacterium]
MRSIKTMLLILFAFTGILLSANEFDWFTQAAENPAAYRQNSSGKISFSFDKNEKAMRFDVVFPKGGDNWFYPYLMFPAGKNLEGAAKLVFEIKAVQEDSPKNFYSTALVMFADGMPRAKYTRPNAGYQKVEIDLAKYVNAPEKVKHIRIGMNPRGGKKMVCFIRNAKLLPAQDSGSLPLKEAAWAKVFTDTARWKANASGTTAFSQIPNGIAVKVDFKHAKDNWCYPYFMFPAGKTLAGVKKIRFNIRINDLPENGKVIGQLVMFADGMPRAACPRPGKTVKTVIIDVTKYVKNPEKVKSIRIGLNTRNCAAVSYEITDLAFLTGEDDNALAVEEIIRTDAPGGIFTKGETLRFFSAAVFPELFWELRDWKDRKIDGGKWKNNSRTLELKPLETGYYSLRFSAPGMELSGKRTFMVVAAPEVRSVNKNSFFALDTAQSQLGRPDRRNSRFPGEGWTVLSEAAKRVGAPIIRERYSFRRTAMEPGKYRWFEYETNANLLKARSIDILGMYADAPPRVRGKLQNLPADLLQTFIYNRDAAEIFKDRVRYWEFWNEPDLSFVRAGAWDYAAAAKAAYLGFKAGNPDSVVALAGIAWTPLLPYNQLVIDNGLADYFDIFNVHTYRPLREYEDMMNNVFAFLAKNNINTPVWFTETGSNAEGMGRSASYIPALRAHDETQELILTEYLPKAMILQQSLGVDRNFFFVFGPYNENAGRKDWGMFRRDYSAKPCVAAFATLTELFANARFCGTFTPQKGVRGFLYQQPDGTLSAALWARSELDDLPNNPALQPQKSYAVNVELQVPDGTYKGRDTTGMPLVFRAVKNRLTLTVDRYPVYITGLSGLKADKPFVRRKTSFAPERTELDKTVIVRADFDDRFSLTGDKENLLLSGKKGGLTVEVYNLSDREKSGSLEISGAKFSNIPEKIRLKPYSRQVFQCDVEPVFSAKTGKVRVNVNGVFNGKKISPLVIPMIAPGQMLADVRQLEMENMLDPLNWRKNSSGEMDISLAHTEKAIRFDVKFAPNSPHWIYPEYILQIPQESLAGATAVTFEIKTTAKRPSQSILMLVYGTEKEQGESIYLRFPTPTGSWEKRTILLDKNKVDAAKIKMLRIGMNPGDGSCSFMLRNFKVYF